MTISPQAFAQQITVTGNGSESVNQVVLSDTTETNIQQTNEANVINTISNEVNTGNNEISNNTKGDTMIQTGDATQHTQVTNSVNTSVVEQGGCCIQQPTNIYISNNGAFSTNNISANNSTTTRVDVHQNANVLNTLYSEANTGNNDASYNTKGDSVIKSGDIYATTKVKNSPINLSYIKLPTVGNNKDHSIKVFGNGFGSWNTVDLDETYDTFVETVNIANVLNDLKENYSTGYNKVKFNNDDSAILTGDISAFTSINNGPINVSKVAVECVCEKKKEVKEKEEEEKKKIKEKEREKEKEVPAAPVERNVPPPSEITLQVPPPVAPVVHIEAVAPQLPITGNNWLMLALFGNIMMLLLGAYLRLRSGRSPGDSLAL